MKKIGVLVVCLMVVCGAQAQVRKCTGPDGKVTYSDFLCEKNTAVESGVRTEYNTISSSNGAARQASKCDIAISNYKAALARTPQTLHSVHLMPEYMAIRALCDRPPANEKGEKTECDGALAKYKQWLSEKPRYLTQIPTSPEAITVNAKCGQGTIQ